MVDLIELFLGLWITKIHSLVYSIRLLCVMSNVEEIDYDSVSEVKKDKKSNDPGDFPSLFADLFMRINWKMAFFLFLIFIILTSDVFIDKALRKIPGSVNNMTSTNKGSVIQGVFLVLFFIIMDAVISSKTI
jgi:hypothetical protein